MEGGWEQTTPAEARIEEHRKRSRGLERLGVAARSSKAVVLSHGPAPCCKEQERVSENMREALDALEAIAVSVRAFTPREAGRSSSHLFPRLKPIPVLCLKQGCMMTRETSCCLRGSLITKILIDQA